MTPTRVVIELEDLRPVRATLIGRSGEPITLQAPEQENALLHAVLARLGFGAFITVMDGNVASTRTLATAGKTLTLSITNQVDTDDDSESEWPCVARVRVDDIDRGSFTLDTADPVFHEWGMLEGILGRLGVDVGIENVTSNRKG